MKEKILWIDLEMTGLHPEEDKIVEVGAIITDWDFNEIAEFEMAVKLDEDFLRKRMTGDFWQENSQTREDLIFNSVNAQFNSFEVEEKLLEFVKKHCAEQIENGEKIILAGNSIHQDRRFIRVEWKKLSKLLHYRMLDVSSWKVVMNAKFKCVFAKPENHRAVEDIRGSIEELKFYLKKVKK